MGHTFARATIPLAGVLLLPALNMIVMDVFYELVHITQIACFAALPSAGCYLFLEVFVVKARIRRGAWDIAIRIFGHV
jgi:hypothetical protein